VNGVIKNYPLYGINKIAVVIVGMKIKNIMNRNEQQMYKDISDLTKALTKLIKLIEKHMKYDR
jgi:hypothetical protein